MDKELFRQVFNVIITMLEEYLKKSNPLFGPVIARVLRAAAEALFDRIFAKVKASGITLVRAPRAAKKQRK